MLSRLVDGRFVPPSSIEEGETRIVRLEKEIEKIGRQLDEPTRPLLHKSADDYQAWATRARSARERLRQEIRFTREWIKERRQEMVPLLRAARRVLQRLELDPEGGFDESAAEVMERLDKFFEGEDAQAHRPPVPATQQRGGER